MNNQTNTRLLIRRYRIQMWIEEMYGDMIEHGFDLEATHLADANRIARLVLAVCLTFVWFITLGSWVVKRGWRHFLDHKCRRDKSCLRLVWDWMERCLRLNQRVPIRFSPCFESDMYLDSELVDSEMLNKTGNTFRNGWESVL